MAEEKKEVVELQGKLRTALLRNVKEIKKARAESIIGDAELSYRRKVEDLGIALMRDVRKLEDRLDMSPDNATTIINVKSFEPGIWVRDDLEIGRSIRNNLIDFKIARARYEDLFGPMVEVAGMIAIEDIESLVNSGSGGL